MPVRSRMVGDLPEPVGPRQPKISPLATSNETRLTATNLPNLRSRSLTVPAMYRSGAAMLRLPGHDGDDDFLERRPAGHPALEREPCVPQVLARLPPGGIRLVRHPLRPARRVGQR